MNALEIISEVALWVLRTTFKASVLAGLVLVIRIIFRNRLPASWRYALWMLLIIRLVMPTGLESGLSVFNLFNFQNQESLVSEAAFKAANISSRPEINDSEIGYSKGEYATSASSLDEVSLSKSSDCECKFSTINIFGITWFMGAIGFAVFSIAGILKFRRKIRGWKPVTDQDILALFNQCKKQMNISSAITILEGEGIGAPMIYGSINPRILLPLTIVNSLNREQLRHIFLHELAHHKRKDAVIAWITAILQILHWFNPVIRFAFFRMRIDRELACDALTLSKIGSDKSDSYGRTIISLLENIVREYRLPVAIGILETKNDLKRRLVMISKYKKHSAWWSVPGVLLLFALGCFSLTEATKTFQNDKPYASEINIEIIDRKFVKVDGEPVPIDSISRKLNKFRFDDQSIVTLVPAKNISLRLYNKLQRGLQFVNINKIKYINAETGKAIITAQYNFRNSESYVLMDSTRLLPVNINGKYGFKDKQGKLVIEPKFDQAWFFDDDLAGVKLKEKWGFINKNGKFVIEPGFAMVRGFREGFCEVRINNKWGYIDKTGQMRIKPQFDRAYCFREGYASVKIRNKAGFIDKAGNFIAPPIYEDAREFRAGLAPVQLNSRWGFIDKNGNTVIGFNFEAAEPFRDGLAVVKANSSYGYIDTTGAYFIEPKYAAAERFSEGLAAVRMAKGKYGYIDKSGQLVIEPQFDFANSFCGGMAIVTVFANPALNITGQGLMIDKAGNTIQ